MHLAVPQAPADVLNSIAKAGAFLAVLIGHVRPAFDGLGDVLNTHRKVKPVKYMMRWTDARLFSQRTWTIGAVAQDGNRRPWCCSKIMQHATQLLCLPIGLGRHAAEYHLVAVVVADLGDENLEGRPW